ncbi:MAG: vanadium-dependent haloperoxidase [Chthonomonas sp.]|nr:vanadium-dependent haloperoxidase [Chthonomonas sp.]
MGKAKLLLTSLVTAAILSGCGGGSPVAGTDLEANAVIQWNRQLLDSVTRSTIGPPATARAISIVHTCIYDAWAAYDIKANGTMLGGTLRRPQAEHTFENKRRAISYAAYRALLNLYPAETATLRAKMTAMGYDPDDATEDLSTAQGIGNRAARAVLEFRATDGSNQSGNYADTSGYVPVNTAGTVNDPAQWQPIQFVSGATPGFLSPHWNRVAPFGLTRASQFRTDGPPAYGSGAQIAQAQELLNITSNLTDKQRVIAEYWADGPRSVTPPGHWNLFAQYVSSRDRHDLDKDVKMFFILGNTLFDASVACWDMKRVYNSSRPWTQLRQMLAGTVITTYVPGVGYASRDGSQWYPWQPGSFITPPFPEYTSGHSTFSASSAEVLKRFTGSDSFGYSDTFAARASKVDATFPASAVTLYWDTFTAAADEAGMSRLYGGIHFRAGDLDGRDCGRKLGAYEYDFCMSYINGTREAPIQQP